MLVVSIAIGIVERNEIRLRRIFPAILELLRLSATTLREARITDFILVCQNLSASGLNGLFYGRTRLFGDALITLAMVIGTDIEDGMVVAVVPANHLIILLDKREERSPTLFLSLTFGHLRQEPRTGDDGMRLQEFQ